MKDNFPGPGCLTRIPFFGRERLIPFKVPKRLRSIDEFPKAFTCILRKFRRQALAQDK